MIMAHSDPALLRTLVELLDDSRNDLFLHIDARSNDIDIASVARHVTRAKITILPRTAVNWGGFSQVRCELALLREATRSPHLYYHLLSGSDIPLLGNDRLHDFFASRAGAEFIHFVPGSLPNHIKDRTRVRRLFPEARSSQATRGVHYVQSRAERLSSTAQRRVRKVPDWRWGSQWFSITDDFARYVLQNRNWIVDTFSRTACADEHFLQTMVIDSPFVERLSVAPDSVQRNGSARLIDWARGDGRSPHTWRIEDLNRLRRAPEDGYAFARKFNSSVDHQVIDEVVRMVQP